MTNTNELTAKCHQIIEDAKTRHKDVEIYAPILRWSEFMALTEGLEAAEKTSAARLEAIDRSHKMYQRERDRAEAAEKRIAELEIRISQQRSIAAHNLDMFRRADARVAELEEIATDYGMKFQRSQDNLKKMVLMHRDEDRTLNVKLPQGYTVRAGHPINEGERGVMIPKDGGDWLNRFDVEHELRSAGIKLQIEGE